MPDRTSAIVFIPAGLDAPDWSAEAAEYCQARGYVIRHLVRHWREVEALLHIDDQYVVVVPTRGHLPPARLPRLDVIDEQEERPAPPGQRRPRRAAPW